jgi:hypothetical protein
MGVPTSITAFIGRALRGPDNEATVINSYADFERSFGGLWRESGLGFAIRDFYLNAPGGQAVIVRLAPDAESTEITADTLTFKAKYPGSWGNKLQIRIDHDVLVDPGTPDPDKFFNLTVAEVEGGTKTEAGTVLQIETFRNVSVATGSSRRVDRVLSLESKLLQYAYPASEPVRPKANEAPAPGSAAPPQDPKPLWGLNETNYRRKDDNTQDGSDGRALKAEDFIGPGLEGDKKGLYALEQADIFNLLCIPPDSPAGDIDSQVIEAAITYCRRRRAMLIIDPPSTWKTKKEARDGVTSGFVSASPNAAVFFPRLRQPNPVRNGLVEEFAPCGAVAGVFARTDGERGVWKAPAGLSATLVGVPALSVNLTDAENGELNPLGVNCLRSLPAAGRVIWGARTRVGDDRLASEWKYIPVRRLALYIEESLYRGTQWAVFEPNDEPLWAALRLNIGSFMHSLFRQGAFQGATAREAYLVKCDKETTTQDDINRGIVNIVVGFAPLKPAEFVIIKLQQLAGQQQT